MWPFGIHESSISFAMRHRQVSRQTIKNNPKGNRLGSLAQPSSSHGFLAHLTWCAPTVTDPFLTKWNGVLVWRAIWARRQPTRIGGNERKWEVRAGIDALSAVSCRTSARIRRAMPSDPWNLMARQMRLYRTSQEGRNGRR